MNFKTVKWYRLDIDDFIDDVFTELEKISEGRAGHVCEISASTKDEAVGKIIDGIKPLISGKTLEQ